MTEDSTIDTDGFESWPKIPRLSKETVYITEKIDGTNAQILITNDGRFKIGSRNRWLTPDDDNFGFARWATDNKGELLKLGHGRHYGEWWGQGIQRGYGLTEKRFSLFNTFIPDHALPLCVSKVPTLHIGQMTTTVIKDHLALLSSMGSIASPGFRKPEGIVVYYHSIRSRFKVILDKDDQHKWQVAE